MAECEYTAHRGVNAYTHRMSDTLQLKTRALLPGIAVLSIITRALQFKTAGRGAAGPHFIMLFKDPIRQQLPNGKACKSYIIHVEEAQEHSSSPLHSVSCWEEPGREDGKGKGEREMMMDGDYG